MSEICFYTAELLDAVIFYGKKKLGSRGKTGKGDQGGLSKGGVSRQFKLFL